MSSFLLLRDFVNISFEDGVFPSALKRARFIILFKGGSRNDPSSHRPLSLLSVFSEILKKPILSRLFNFLNSTDFFHDAQFDFRAKHSTEHACANLLNYLHIFLDSGLIPAALYLDVGEAFDSITHMILLWKLSILEC